jgi:hypothetical protein
LLRTHVFLEDNHPVTILDDDMCRRVFIDITDDESEDISQAEIIGSVHPPVVATNVATFTVKGVAVGDAISLLTYRAFAAGTLLNDGHCSRIFSTFDDVIALAAALTWNTAILAKGVLTK